MPQRARLAVQRSLRATVPAQPSLFFEPTAHRCNACAHRSRRRRHARALYAHLHRLPLGMRREVRLLGVRHMLPLAFTAFVHLLTACAPVFGHPIGAAVAAYDIVSIHSCARHNSPLGQRFERHYSLMPLTYENAPAGASTYDARKPPGSDLFSHTLANAVSSALRRFTAVFGMGTGGAA